MYISKRHYTHLSIVKSQTNPKIKQMIRSLTMYDEYQNNYSNIGINV